MEGTREGRREGGRDGGRDIEGNDVQVVRLNKHGKPVLRSSLQNQRYDTLSKGGARESTAREAKASEGQKAFGRVQSLLRTCISCVTKANGRVES